jgi:RND family efflux transporter MFP subunit
VGDEVEQGQVLARLEHADLEYQIDLAQIDVDLAQLGARSARENNATPLDIEIADKEVERARLALERLATQQQALLVTAPYSGRVTDIDANPGMEIAAYHPILTIVGSEQVIIVAEFSGPKAGRIVAGQMLELQDFFDGKIAFKGQVVGLVGADSPGALIVEPATGADAPPAKLKLGDTFKATAVLGRADNVLTLPTSALKTIGDRRYVVVVDNGELRRVFVDIGIETEGIVEIKSGVQAGQNVSER